MVIEAVPPAVTASVSAMSPVPNCVARVASAHGDMDWREVRLENIAEFVAWLRRPSGLCDGTVPVLPDVKHHCTEATVNRNLSSLRAFYQHAARHGIRSWA